MKDELGDVFERNIEAAELGEANAQNALGDMYYEGQSVQRDYEEALKWQRKAAEQGYKGAQCLLAQMYYFGEGVEVNYDEALKWYRKAAGKKKNKLNI